MERRRPGGWRRGALAIALAGSLGTLAATDGAGPAAASTVSAPAAHRGPARIVVGGTPGARVSRRLFGANLLWPAGGGGALDVSTGRFYTSFLSMVRHLGVTALRYPGGTTADSFQWERAVGALAHRRVNEPFGMQAGRFVPDRTVLDGPVPSSLGPREFGSLLDRTGAVGNVVVNFATGTVGEAAAFVDYLTGRAPDAAVVRPSQAGYWAALRAREGHPAPYHVAYFEVGNEQQVSAEEGWRAGRLVALGPHDTACPAPEVATCLYVFGGTTRFVRQRVGTFANELPSSSRSTGRANQRLFAYYPPVVPGSEQVEVGGRRWRPVADLRGAGRRAHVYAFTPSDGRIQFGDGTHGAIPPAGARITVSYDSGPHGGFVAFYAAMKQVDPAARICATEGTSRAFLDLMGQRHPYDCLEFHAYATARDTRAPLDVYERNLMAFPGKEGAALAGLQRAAARAAGHAVPVVVTEYGQPVAPMPVGDHRFLLSLDEGLLVAAQLRQWILHDVPLAEKYLLVSSSLARPVRPVVLDRARTRRHGSGPLPDVAGAPRQPGLAVKSAMIAGAGGRFVAEPSGLVLELVHELAGTRLLDASVRHGPRLGPAGTPALLPLATAVASGVDVLVENTNLRAATRATIAFDGVAHGRRVVASVLDGPQATAYNTIARHLVRIRTTARTVGHGDVAWRFPPHSLTLLRFR